MRYSNLFISLLFSIHATIASSLFYNKNNNKLAFIKNASREKDQSETSTSRLSLRNIRKLEKEHANTSSDFSAYDKTHNIVIVSCNKHVNLMNLENVNLCSPGACLYAIEKNELIKEEAIQSHWNMLPLSKYFVDKNDFDSDAINEEKTDMIGVNINPDIDSQKNNETEGKENDDDPPNPDDADFDSGFCPEDMRCLALVADNKMKPALRKFLMKNRNVLKKFSLTGTSSTMAIVREVFGNDTSVVYGPVCKSGPLGGNAELCAQMCRDQLGAVIFLQDPMDSHPHQADIECLCRQGLVHNVLMAVNISSANSLMCILRLALKSRDTKSIRSFFNTEYSPSVVEYKRRQGEIVKSLIENNIERHEDSKYFVSRDQILTGDIGCHGHDPDFDSAFEPEEMRCLALVSHNHMKPAMRDFIQKNKNVLKKFRLTGTSTTMAMLREVYGDDPDVVYGPSCQSGPLGGDAELCAQMCLGELGGIIFFQDPMDSHPHQADIACLNRQSNIHDVYVAHNPLSAYAMTKMMRYCLERGLKMSSFFETKKSPTVAEYAKFQSGVLNETTT